MKISIFNEQYDLRFVLEEYPQGGTAVHLITVDGHKPSALFTRLSVWTEATPRLKPGEFFVRPWRENQELLTKLTEGGYIQTVETPDQGTAGIRLYQLAEKGRQWISPHSH